MPLPFQNRPDVNFRRNWIGFFLLGLSNIFPYAMVCAAANPLVRSYDKETFVATVYGAAGSTTILVKLLNTFILTRVSYNVRFVINTLIMILGIAGVAFSPTFIMAMFGVVVVGTSYAFGENLALGYLSLFDSRLVNAWSSGAGCAGLMGAVSVITTSCVIPPSDDKTYDFKLLIWYSFLACCPFVLLYFLAYFMVICEPPDANSNNVGRPDVVGQSINASEVPNGDAYDGCHDSETEPILTPQPEAVIIQQQTRMTLSDRWLCFKLIWKLGVMLALATFASYVCRVSAAKAEDRTKYDQDCPNIYASLQLCFMAAQFASLSSVQLIRIRRIEILMIVQILNAVVWVLHTRFKFIPVYILPSYMVLIGLIAGAVYVNTFYMVHNDDKYPQERKELLANMTAVFLTVGISLCSILMTVLYSSVLLLH